METIGQRIAFLRKNAKQTKVAVGKAVGVSDVTIGYWERDINEPSREPLRELAKFFGVTEDYILYGLNQENVTPIEKVNVGLRRIPVIAWADIPQLQNESFTESFSDAQDTLAVDDTYSKNAFAIRVKGDFMEGDSSKTIPDGSIAIVEPDIGAENLSGKVVLAIVGDNHVPTVKEYQTDGHSTYLVPWNKRYKVVEIDDVCTVLGYLRDVIIQISR
jgi:SOS-response transcriptional repressor LexA